jgi:hypothetical protein
VVGVLGVAVCAVLAGAKSLAAIGEWAADAPGQVLAALRTRRGPLTGAFRPPGEATVRRVLARVDPDALDRAIGQWLTRQQPPPPASRPPLPQRAVAVDGKTLRGSGHHRAAPVHLLAAMDHATAAVLAQADVDHTTNEIARFRPLLERLDLTDVVITADALPTQREHANWLVTHKHADYLLLVKANQPTLHRQLQRLPWPQVPVADHTHNRGHGRVEVRCLQVTPSPAWTSPTPPRPCGSPAASGPARPPLTHRDGVRHHQPHRRPCPPRPNGRLYPRPLGHRGAAPHPRRHPRRGRLTGLHPHRPRAMASLRNLAIAALGAHGHRTIAAALRYTPATPPASYPCSAASAGEPDKPALADALGSRVPCGRAVIPDAMAHAHAQGLGSRTCRQERRAAKSRIGLARPGNSMAPSPSKRTPATVVIATTGSLTSTWPPRA